MTSSGRRFLSRTRLRVRPDFASSISVPLVGLSLLTPRPARSTSTEPLNNPLLSSIATSSATATAAAASAASAKKARQNAARAEAKKAAKQDSEAERLRALAAHKKRLEQARIEEIYRKGRGKAIGGGMTASVSSNGKLEWD
jgi:FKBP-type peptidyl-prolyl cis-trans isomerase